MKKVISLFLSIALLLSLPALPALAVEDSGEMDLDQSDVTVAQSGKDITFTTHGYSVTLHNVLSWEDVPTEEILSYEYGSIPGKIRVYHVAAGSTYTLRNISCKYDTFVCGGDARGADLNEQKDGPWTGKYTDSVSTLRWVRQCPAGSSVDFPVQRLEGVMMFTRPHIILFPDYQIYAGTTEDGDYYTYHEGGIIFNAIADDGKVSYTNRTIEGKSYPEYYYSEFDKPSSWAEAELDELYESMFLIKQLNGVNFRMDINRGFFCNLMMTVLYKKTNMTGEEFVASKGLTVTNPFKDVMNRDTGILQACALGIVNGTSPDTFSPDGYITRREAAAMLARTAKLLNIPAGEGVSFSDLSASPDWAKESVSYISGVSTPSGKKVMGGIGNGCFGPLGRYTCEQAFITAYRLFQAAP